MVKLSNWNPVDYLKTREDMAMYLEAAFEEDLGDGRVICAMLRHIARAQGFTDDKIDRLLPPEKTLDIATVIKATQTLGLQFHVTPIEEQESHLDGGRHSINDDPQFV